MKRWEHFNVMFTTNETKEMQAVDMVIEEIRKDYDIEINSNKYIEKFEHMYSWLGEEVGEEVGEGVGKE